MITDKYKKINTINGVGAGATTTVSLPLGARIKDLILVYKGNAAEAVMIADLLTVKLVINGQPRRSPSAAQIILLEKHEGRTITAGLLPVRFRNPSASDDQWEDRTALNTFRMASAALEITIDAAAVAPTLECYACYDNVDDKNDFLCVWDSVTFGNQGAGVKNKTDLVKVGILQRIDFFGAANLPTAVKLRADENEIIDLSAAVQNRFGLDYGYQAQANHLALLATNTRRPQEGLFLDAVGRYEVEITTAAAGDITAIVQRLVNTF